MVERFVRTPPAGANAQRERFAELTERELEVLTILRKLDLRDRVQAVVLAYETGLVEPGGDQSPASSST